MYRFEVRSAVQASGLLAGTKPLKAAVRLSLTDWVLAVLFGTGTSVSSLTVAVADATVALISEGVDQRGHGGAADALSRTRRLPKLGGAPPQDPPNFGFELLGPH